LNKEAKEFNDKNGCAHFTRMRTMLDKMWYSW